MRDEYPPSLQHLLRAVLDMVEPHSGLEESMRPTAVASEHVLLDIDVEGARYVLMRMPVSERKAVPLSPRELEIVRMVAQGHQNKIIAVVLNISSWTVCTHLRRIFAKLGVTSRAAMVARLAEFMVVPEQPGSGEPSKPLLGVTVEPRAMYDPKHRAAARMIDSGLRRELTTNAKGPPQRRGATSLAS